MNWSLFSAFLLITVVLFLTPGPIVTLIIATRKPRRACTCAAGASAGAFSPACRQACTPSQTR
jgi:threonine/homoserine/homoserine lactone efflux protein